MTPNRVLDMHWSNNQELYHAVLAYGAWVLNRVTTMTDQTLGRNVRDNLQRWADEGRVSRLGWGPDHYPAVAYGVLRAMDQEVEWQAVAEAELGADVREALGVDRLATTDYMDSQTFVWHLRRGEDGKAW